MFLLVNPASIRGRRLFEGCVYSNNYGIIRQSYQLAKLPIHFENHRRGVNLPSCACGIMVLTLLGAWFGAFTLPLDWDREWQVGVNFSPKSFSSVKKERENERKGWLVKLCHCECLGLANTLCDWSYDGTFYSFIIFINSFRLEIQEQEQK